MKITVYFIFSKQARFSNMNSKIFIYVGTKTESGLFAVPAGHFIGFVKLWLIYELLVNRTFIRLFFSLPSLGVIALC